MGGNEVVLIIKREKYPPYLTWPLCDASEGVIGEFTSLMGLSLVHPWWLACVELCDSSPLYPAYLGSVMSWVG